MSLLILLLRSFSAFSDNSFTEWSVKLIFFQRTMKGLESSGYAPDLECHGSLMFDSLKKVNVEFIFVCSAILI